MPMDTLNHDDYADRVIDHFGGTSAMARICKVKPASVSDWRKYGIPAPRLAFLKVAFPTEFIEIDGKRPVKPRLEPGRRQA